MLTILNWTDAAVRPNHGKLGNGTLGNGNLGKG